MPSNNPLKRTIADLGKPFGLTAVIECPRDEEIAFEPLLMTADSGSPLVELLPWALRAADVIRDAPPLEVAQTLYSPGFFYPEGTSQTDPDDDTEGLPSVVFHLFPEEGDPVRVLLAIEGDEKPKLLALVWLDVADEDGQP